MSIISTLLGMQAQPAAAPINPAQAPYVPPSGGQQSAAANIPGATTHVNPPSGQVPADLPAPPNPNPTDTNGVIDFNTLFTPQVTAAIQEAESVGNIFEINAEQIDKVRASANTMNFVDMQRAEELVQQFQAGDSRALIELIQMANRETYIKNLTGAGSLINRAAQDMAERVTKTTTPHLRVQQALDQLVVTNPQFAAPAIKPQAADMIRRLMHSTPTLTPEAAAAHVAAFFGSLAGSTGAASSQASVQNSPQHDFGGFFQPRT